VAIAAVMYAARLAPLTRYVCPDFPVPDPAQRLFGHLCYTEEQSAAITEAGFAIQKGHTPASTLSPESLAQLREVHAMVQDVDCALDEAVCRRYRLPVLDCLERAGALIGRRLGKVEEIPWNLYTAAMGVSVVTREIHYRTVAALVHFCERFNVAQEQYDPQRAPGRDPAT
jgi:hypothetical protein